MRELLNVFWEKELVGKIIKEIPGFRFQYASEWIKNKNVFPISISLPLRQDIFERDVSESFFGNLLPESTIRERIARLYGFSKKNDYAMLNAIGNECAGALMILLEGMKIPEHGSYFEVSSYQLNEMIINYDKRPLIMGIDGIRLSLAGAQEKIPVYFKDERYFLPKGINSSNYIVKPLIQGLFETVINEAFCMKLAKRVGMDVPDVEIKSGKTHHFLLVKRYDRIEEDDNVVKRLHQEDFCQARGLSYNNKYESEGGPSLVDCFLLIDKYSAKSVFDKQRLIEFIIFNYYIGNADAHAKNISFLYKNNTIILAPFYDLISTLVYKNLNKKMAMKIGKENKLEWIRKRHFERLAEYIDIKPKFIIEQLETFGFKIETEAELLMQDFIDQGINCIDVEKNIVEEIVNIIKKQRKLVNK